MTTQFLTFNPLNSLNNTPKVKANEKKSWQSFVWSNTLSNLQSKFVTDNVIKNDLSIFYLGPKT